MKGRKNTIDLKFITICSVNISHVNDHITALNDLHSKIFSMLGRVATETAVFIDERARPINQKIDTKLTVFRMKINRFHFESVRCVRVSKTSNAMPFFSCEIWKKKLKIDESNFKIIYLFIFFYLYQLQLQWIVKTNKLSNHFFHQ